MKPKTLFDFPRPKVFFPLASYDWRAHVQYFYSILDILSGSYCAFNTFANFQDGVARARNGLAHHFLHSTQDEFLFWIAGDIKCTSHDVNRILNHMVVGELDIVGGLYAGKGQRLKWIANFPTERPAVDPTTGLAEATRAGTDFLCVRRKVYETIREKHTELAYRAPDLVEGTCVDFHPMPIHNGDKESEDWAFCRLAREAGFKVWIDTRVIVAHIGQIEFPLVNSLSDETIHELVRHRFKADLPALLATKPTTGHLVLPAT